MYNRKKSENCPSTIGIKRQQFQEEQAVSSPSIMLRHMLRRVTLWFFPRKKGSLTVEAAVTIPVFLLTMSMLIGILDIYRIQSVVKTSLHESAMELGMYAYGDGKKGGFSSIACQGYAYSQLPKFGKQVKITMIGSEISHSYIKLKAQIFYKLPVTLFFLPPIHIVSNSRARCWVGENGEFLSGEEGSGEELVYVSEYESVYHISSTCTHIELSIHQSKRNEIEKLRNEYGERYHICEKCGAGKGETVYYTDKGNCYHTSLECSGLKRTVYLIKKSEADRLQECTRCEEREKIEEKCR